MLHRIGLYYSIGTAQALRDSHGVNTASANPRRSSFWEPDMGTDQRWETANWDKTSGSAE